MLKKILFVVVLFAMAFTVPVSAAWTERISGGMSYSSIGEFTVTLSAWDNGGGDFGGQGQYYYPGNGNTFHLEVEKICTGTANSGEPYVIAIGPIKLQDGTVLGGAEYGAIAVVEGGEAADRVRVKVYSSLEDANAFCTGGDPGASVKVLDGNFNIRSK